MPVDSKATVFTPHFVNHAAISRRSAVLAPKCRTGLASRSAGTQTMCMSEWTSIPAASGLMRLSPADEAGTGTGSDLSRGLLDLVGFRRLVDFLGSSFGTTMDVLRFADGDGETTKRREPRGGFGDV